jgi:putative nucleotidyltransferase with HDIG domain
MNMSSEPYKIDRSSNSRRQVVEEWLFGLDLVSPEVRDNIVTAWVSSWASSPHATLEEMPFTHSGAFYPLMQHVNEVTRAGLDLARRAAADWGKPLDMDKLVSILILHDVDKPLLYVRDGEALVTSQLYKELPHGVVGAMLLKELGFPHEVVSVVATHATNAPFHASTHEAYVLHYADMFAADHAMLEMGRQPFYQRKH